MSENTFKVYSRDDELYCFDSIDDLFDDLDAYGDLVVGRTYYEADGQRIEPNDFTGKWIVEAILERFDDELYEEVGEIADKDFAGVADESKAELAKLMADWIEKHVNVGRYWKIVSKTRQMEVGPDDIREGGAA